VAILGLKDSSGVELQTFFGVTGMSFDSESFIIIPQNPQKLDKFLLVS
jgi:hypothetical protein